MYTGIKKVRDLNGQQFIDDLKHAQTILVMAVNTGISFRVDKTELWDMARTKKIKYITNYCPFVIKRRCLTVL